MRDIEFISYDGKYPNLCSGNLTYSVDGIILEQEYALLSGGECYWDSENQEEIITAGEWRFSYSFIDRQKESSDGLTEEEQEKLLSQINSNVMCGCCGGCTYEEWENGIEPKPIKELHCPMMHFGQGTDDGNFVRINFCEKVNKCFVGTYFPKCAETNRESCWKKYADLKGE